MRLLTFRQLIEEKGVPFTRPWLNTLIEQGKFPAPLKFKGRRVMWLEESINEWMEGMK